MSGSDKKSMPQGRIFLKNIGIAAGVGLVVILALAFFAALLMNAEKIPSEITEWMSRIILFIGSFAASFFSAAAAEKRRLLCGAAASAVLLLLLVLIGAGIRSAEFSKDLLVRGALFLLAGGIAGGLLSALKGGHGRRQR